MTSPSKAEESLLAALASAKNASDCFEALQQAQAGLIGDPSFVFCLGKPFIAECRRLYEVRGGMQGRAIVMGVIADFLGSIGMLYPSAPEREEELANLHTTCIKAFFLSALRHLKPSTAVMKPGAVELLAASGGFCAVALKAPARVSDSLLPLLGPDIATVARAVGSVAASIPFLPFYRVQADAFVAVNRVVRSLMRAKEEAALKTIEQMIVESGWGSMTEVLAPNQTGEGKATVEDILLKAQETVRKQGRTYETLTAIPLSGFLQQATDTREILKECSSHVAPLHVGLCGLSTVGEDSTGAKMTVNLSWTSISSVVFSEDHKRIMLELAEDSELGGVRIIFHVPLEADFVNSRQAVISFHPDALKLVDEAAKSQKSSKRVMSEIVDGCDPEVARLRRTEKVSPSGDTKTSPVPTPVTGPQDPVGSENMDDHARSILVAEAMNLSTQVPDQVQLKERKVPKSSTSSEILIVGQPNAELIPPLEQNPAAPALSVGPVSDPRQETEDKGLKLAKEPNSDPKPARKAKDEAKAPKSVTAARPVRSAAKRAIAKGFQETDEVEGAGALHAKKASHSLKQELQFEEDTQLPGSSKPSAHPAGPATKQRSAGITNPPPPKDEDDDSVNSDFEFIDDENPQPSRGSKSARPAAKAGDAKAQKSTISGKPPVSENTAKASNLVERPIRKLTYTETVQKKKQIAPELAMEAILSPPPKRARDNSPSRAEALEDGETMHPAVPLLSDTGGSAGGRTATIRSTRPKEEATITFGVEELAFTPPAPEDVSMYCDNSATEAASFESSTANNAARLMELLGALANIGENAGAGDVIHAYAKQMIDSAKRTLDTIERSFSKQLDDIHQEARATLSVEMQHKTAANARNVHSLLDAALEALREAQQEFEERIVAIHKSFKDLAADTKQTCGTAITELRQCQMETSNAQAKCAEKIASIAESHIQRIQELAAQRVKAGKARAKSLTPSLGASAVLMGTSPPLSKPAWSQAVPRRQSIGAFSTSGGLFSEVRKISERFKAVI